jgi:hypothetical protein
VLENGADLVERDARKQLDELSQRNAIFEILEQRGYGHPRTSKTPSATDAIRVALHGRTSRPIDHGRTSEAATK